MFRKILLALALGCVFGCSPTSEKAGSPLISKVNADDKCFRGTWVYKSSSPGNIFKDVVRTRIEIIVSGKKFRITGKWGVNVPPDERRTEEWFYDGNILWNPVASQKQVNWMELKRFKKYPFWKMSARISSFGSPEEAGEGEIAGRPVRILKLTGKYARADVTFAYWVDKETSLLLKKEHILGPLKDPLIKEAYECEAIEYEPELSEDMFVYEVPQDFIKVKKRYLDCELLETNF